MEVLKHSHWGAKSRDAKSSPTINRQYKQKSMNISREKVSVSHATFYCEKIICSILGKIDCMPYGNILKISAPHNRFLFKLQSQKPIGIQEKKLIKKINAHKIMYKWRNGC